MCFYKTTKLIALITWSGFLITIFVKCKALFVFPVPAVKRFLYGNPEFVSVTVFSTVRQEGECFFNELV